MLPSTSDWLTISWGGQVQPAREQLRHRETGFAGAVEGSWPPTCHTFASADIIFPGGPLTHYCSVYTGDTIYHSIQYCAYWNKTEENKMLLSIDRATLLAPVTLPAFSVFSSPSILPSAILHSRLSEERSK